jgi:hypothetical protein
MKTSRQHRHLGADETTIHNHTPSYHYISLDRSQNVVQTMGAFKLPFPLWVGVENKVQVQFNTVDNVELPANVRVVRY